MSFSDNDSDSDSSFEAPPLLKNFDAPLTSSLSQTRQNLQTQSKIASHQQSLVSSLLELRILMQKPLDEVAKLPDHKDESFPELSDLTFDLFKKDTKELYSEAEDSCLSLLNDLMTLNSELLTCSNVVPHSTDPFSQSTTSSDIWSQISASTMPCYKDHLSSALDQYYQKAKVTSVAGISTLDQPPENLVESLLKHSMDRYISKTQTNRAGIRKILDKEVERNRQDLYDDGDFYHLILKDFVSSSTSGSQSTDDESAKRLLAKHKRKEKLKRSVGERNRKDKKMRFTVISELQNFMHPVPQPFPSVASALFKSLFSRA
ncbi:hypothetical protein RCL1_008325 [Eukaryota sp. TZLM3-RCL]